MRAQGAAALLLLTLGRRHRGSGLPVFGKCSGERVSGALRSGRAHPCGACATRCGCRVLLALEERPRMIRRRWPRITGEALWPRQPRDARARGGGLDRAGAPRACRATPNLLRRVYGTCYRGGPRWSRRWAIDVATGEDRTEQLEHAGRSEEKRRPQLDPGDHRP